MSVNKKNIENCNSLPATTIKIMANRLSIPISTKENMCKQIRRKYRLTNPCTLAIYNNTDLTIKKHQLNVANFLAQPNNRGVVVIHSVGTGKTLTAIATSQCLLKIDDVDIVIVVTPTSLQNNFKSQMEMYGVTSKYFDNYVFFTIGELVRRIDDGSLSHEIIKLVGKFSFNRIMLIVDEAHNLRTLDGKTFDTIYSFAKKVHKVMLLTATPLINYSHDIINLIALAKGTNPISLDEFHTIINVINNESDDDSKSNNKTIGNNKLIGNNKPIGKNNNKIIGKNNNKTLNTNENPYNIDIDEAKEYFSNVFSFHMKPEIDPNFPKRKIHEIFIPMDSEYLTLYNKIEKGKTASIEEFKGKNITVFYNGVRRASNIIEDISPKTQWIINKIKSKPNDKFVIFSHFINMGIKPLMKFLDKKKITYSYITGNSTKQERSKAVSDYNNGNSNILFISKAGSEGLDLKGTNNIIIMESSWNLNSIEQIIGRGARYKSHEGLPKSKQVVNIYKLLSVKPDEYNDIENIIKNNLLMFDDNILSVDLYLRNYAWLKQQEIISFYDLLHEYKV